MKEVLISIQPKWCELIASGKKTVEIRKTAPKIEGPFKCYIYCTKPTSGYRAAGGVMYDDELYRLPSGEIKYGSSCELMLNSGKYDQSNFLNGKVIGEFICDRITPLFNVCYDSWPFLLGDVHKWHKQLVKMACLTEDEIKAYANGKNCYAWQISGLKIYDKPKSLSNFLIEGDCDCLQCKKCAWFEKGNGYNVEDDCLLAYENARKEPQKPLFRAPQSWCYVLG